MSDVLEPREIPVEEKYATAPVVKDPNMPVNADDPHDRIRAEGPEVADPAQQAAHDTFVASGGVLNAEATELEAAAAAKRNEGDLEAATKLSDEAAKKREEADKMRAEAAEPEATAKAEATPTRSKSDGA